MSMVNLSSPWVILYDEIKAMFAQDKDVNVVYDEGKNVIALYVEDSDKADALGTLLNQTRYFGNVKVEVIVVPADEKALKGKSKKVILENAFKDNPIFAYAVEYDTVFGHFTFGVFRNEVCQYYCDNMFDLHGFKSTVYEDIARDIFNPDIISMDLHFCTDLLDNLGQHVSKWPQ